MGGLAAIAHVSLPVKLPGLEVNFKALSMDSMYMVATMQGFCTPFPNTCPRNLFHRRGTDRKIYRSREPDSDVCPDHISERFLSKGESNG